MPELPEVETVRRGLDPVMSGLRIAHADIRRPDLRWPFPPRMSERLTGARVTQLRRRSKYILADLDTRETLLIHLGMSGRIVVQGAQVGVFHHARTDPEKHDHVVLDMEGGARIVFNDPRRFGAMDLMPTATAEDHPLLAALGPEPLGNAFDEDYLVGRLRGRGTPVKAALLDQKIVAGLGNIYVCEALYRAGIHPARKAGKVAPKRIAKLVPIIRDVLSEAIEAGGSSLRDYRQADGDLGYFQHRFRVYGREGGQCATADCPDVVRRVVQSGRSSFYCPTCQR
ncbi:bifunctional DNA-formamidopyrimidine glycosylase/DNA-(apurinic or apyrimidinic site) lyase [Tropicimonas sp. S265A]|uniref:bifunctional DNA-formamidopyrimidine glycosylase/DNA-(apurinic or apyrimidinic site) lyase n=1 Tax=Tropicimonas sp. S265A TaxID=3415134 RepID=UPI003C7CAA38